MSMDELRTAVIAAARKADGAAFDLLRFGTTEAEADTYTVPAEYVRKLSESRMKLHEAIDKLDIERDKEKLRPIVSRYEQRVLDEQLGLREPRLTIPLADDYEIDWDFDMTGRPVYRTHIGN